MKCLRPLSRQPPSASTAVVFQNSLAGQTSADVAMLLFAAAAYVVKNSVGKSEEISV